tara:strand:+ start:173 stop:310 length:138 start_codon:yes stop_codon:yes gene_type:complete
VNKVDINCHENIAPVVICRHAPKELWPEIMKLIDKEFPEKTNRSR